MRPLPVQSGLLRPYIIWIAHLAAGTPVHGSRTIAASTLHHLSRRTTMVTIPESHTDLLTTDVATLATQGVDHSTTLPGMQPRNLERISYEH